RLGDVRERHAGQPRHAHVARAGGTGDDGGGRAVPGRADAVILDAVDPRQHLRVREARRRRIDDDLTADALAPEAVDAEVQVGAGVGLLGVVRRAARGSLAGADVPAVARLGDVAGERAAAGAAGAVAVAVAGLQRCAHRIDAAGDADAAVGGILVMKSVA